MLRKILLVTILAILLVSVAPISAQDEDIPTVAIIRFGPLQPFQLSQKGTLDVLAAYGYVDGENINIILGDAEFDFPTANLLIEDALDNEADVIVAITTPVAQAAVNATLEMENPPVIMFNTVTSPYAAGIADAPCLKPANVWGSQALAPYASVMSLLFELNPDVHTVGYMYNNAEANSVASTEIITQVAEELGIDLLIQTVTSTADVGLAAEALVDDGAEAFFIPTDSTVSDGLPALLSVSEENGIPIVHADSSQVYNGATVAAGLNYYQEGVDTGVVLVNYLQGNVDIATLGLAKQEGTTMAINLDSAAAQGVEIPQEMLDRAAFVIQDGESTEAPPELSETDAEARMEGDSAYIEGLFCSPERIAEQQAELDAAASGD